MQSLGLSPVNTIGRSPVYTAVVHVTEKGNIETDKKEAGWRVVEGRWRRLVLRMEARIQCNATGMLLCVCRCPENLGYGAMRESMAAQKEEAMIHRRRVQHPELPKAISTLNAPELQELVEKFVGTDAS